MTCEDGVARATWDPMLQAPGEADLLTFFYIQVEHYNTTSLKVIYSYNSYNYIYIIIVVSIIIGNWLYTKSYFVTLQEFETVHNSLFIIPANVSVNTSEEEGSFVSIWACVGTSKTHLQVNGTNHTCPEQTGE